MHRKAGAGDAIGKGRWNGVRHLQKSAHLLVESPVKKAFLSTIQANLSCTPFLMRRYKRPGASGIKIAAGGNHIQAKHAAGNSALKLPGAIFIFPDTAFVSWPAIAATIITMLNRGINTAFKFPDPEERFNIQRRTSRGLLMTGIESSDMGIIGRGRTNIISVSTCINSVVIGIDAKIGLGCVMGKNPKTTGGCCRRRRYRYCRVSRGRTAAVGGSKSVGSSDGRSYLSGSAGYRTWAANRYGVGVGH